jgi:hypothetical protein
MNNASFPNKHYCLQTVKMKKFRRELDQEKGALLYQSIDQGSSCPKQC